MRKTERDRAKKKRVSNYGKEVGMMVQSQRGQKKKKMEEERKYQINNT